VRVLFVDQFAQPGGAQLCLKDVMAEAHQRGWTTLLMRPGDGLPESIGSYTNGRKNWRDCCAFPVDMVRAARSIRRIARENRIDLVYANGPRVLPAAAAAELPLVFHAHSYLMAGYARTITRSCLKRTRARVIAASEFVARPLQDMAPASAIRVIYNGVADQRFRARAFDSAVFTIGIVGRIASEKGQLDFISAAREIASSFPETRFVIFGAPLFSGGEYDAEVRRQAPSAGVQLYGWKEDVSEALHAIDILAAPSAAIESTPRVIIEAMSAGTPVVAYPSGGIPELIRSGQTGVLTTGSNPEALAWAIFDLMTNREQMRWISVNARRDWEERFQTRRFVREVCDSLVEVLEERSRVNAHKTRQQHASSAIG
jgi:glycosyltransferase involved in cell wall biosynthesis